MVVVTMELEVSDNMIDTLIVMAGSGIGYWASSAMQDEDYRAYTVVDGEDGTVHTATYEELAVALGKVANREINVSSYIADYAVTALREDDPGEIDSELADVVVQVALFGEIVYG